MLRGEVKTFQRSIARLRSHGDGHDEKPAAVRPEAIRSGSSNLSLALPDPLEAPVDALSSCRPSSASSVRIS